MAEILGISARAVQKLATAGKIPVVREGRKMLFDRAAVLTARAANLDPFRGGKQDQAPGPDQSLGVVEDGEALEPVALAKQRTAHWRARAMKNEAKLGEIELLMKTGVLVRADDVRLRQFKVARAFRDRMLNIPDRVASVIAADSDPAGVHTTLTKEIRDACTELAALDVDHSPS